MTPSKKRAVHTPNEKKVAIDPYLLKWTLNYTSNYLLPVSVRFISRYQKRKLYSNSTNELVIMLINLFAHLTSAVHKRRTLVDLFVFVRFVSMLFCMTVETLGFGQEGFCLWCSLNLHTTTGNGIATGAASISGYVAILFLIFHAFFKYIVGWFG